VAVCHARCRLNGVKALELRPGEASEKNQVGGQVEGHSLGVGGKVCVRLPKAVNDVTRRASSGLPVDLATSKEG
jgi:hypothetical protein